MVKIFCGLRSACHDNGGVDAQAQIAVIIRYNFIGGVQRIAAFSLRLGQFAFIGGDELLCIFLNGFIQSFGCSFNLRDLDIGLKLFVLFS